MNRAQAETFAKDFTRAFAPPKCGPGFVVCKVVDTDQGPALNFRIDRHDVSFDAATMEWYGQGTDLKEISHG